MLEFYTCSRPAFFLACNPPNCHAPPPKPEAEERIEVLPWRPACQLIFPHVAGRGGPPFSHQSIKMIHNSWASFRALTRSSTDFPVPAGFLSAAKELVNIPTAPIWLYAKTALKRRGGGMTNNWSPVALCATLSEPCARQRGGMKAKLRKEKETLFGKGGQGKRPSVNGKARLWRPRGHQGTLGRDCR